MTADKILSTLLLLSLSGSAAILLVLAFRGALRRLAGARLSYMAWLIVPVAMVASMLPARTVMIDLAPPILSERALQQPALAADTMIGAAPAASAHMFDTALPQAAGSAQSIDWILVIVLVWVAGAITSLLVLAARQILAMRALGPLTPISPTLSRTAHATLGPAVVGVLAPRIVLPADFEESYDDTERKVVIAHEEAHLRGRHTLVKTIVEIFVCLGWFNPLAYLASRCIATDQEFACDEAVAARYPGDRRVYASALLKTQAGPHLPLGCYWPAKSSQRLRERITRLGLAAPSRSRRLAAAISLGLLAIGAGCAAWAAKPPRTAIAPAGDQMAQTPLQPVRHEPPSPPASQSSVPLDANDAIYLRGKIETIDFRDASYVAHVRASSIAAGEAAPAQINTALWELAPAPYWGDRDAVTKDLMNASVAVRGLNAARGCASKCRLLESEIIVPKSTALPAPSGEFGMADFAMRYDTSKSYLIRGTVERIEFAERTFDAYVRTDPRGPIPGALFQVRSENRFPRAEVEAQLLRQVVTVAGWRAKGARTDADHEMWPDGPIEPACETVCGLYGTDFELSGNQRLTPAGAKLLSPPATYDPDTIPVVPPGYATVAEIADKNAPLTLTGRITRLDDSNPNTAFFVEAAQLSPGSVSGAERGTLWRVVALEYRPEPDWIGATVTLRGFAAKDKSCQPTCLMSVTNLQVFGRS